MKGKKDLLPDDPEITLTRPHFGEEEKMRARPVVPLGVGARVHNSGYGARRVAFRAPDRRFWKSGRSALVIAALLVVAGVAATTTGPYQPSMPADAGGYTEDSVQQSEKRVPLPPAQAERVMPVATYDRTDEVYKYVDSEDDSDGRRRSWNRRSRDDDERMLRRVRKFERARRELRRWRDIFDH